MGLVEPPLLDAGDDKITQLRNALTEYTTLTRASLRVYAKTARDLLVAYKENKVGVLAGQLAGEDATIYDCNTGKVLAGRSMTKHMTAYNLTDGFVPEITSSKDVDSGQRTFNYAVPPEDTLVVVTRNTRVFLDEKVLQRLDQLGPADTTDFSIEWVNGVPGCGKTSWIVNHYRPESDMIVTTTVEAALDVAERVARRLGAVDKRRVRTVASVLVNGTRLPAEAGVKRVLFDEALMNHFGAVVAVAWVTKAEQLVLIGDVNQIPYIDRLNLFPLKYVRPDCVANISRQLLCTHRNPMDVAYTLRSYYPGIYSSCRKVRSLSCQRYSGANIPLTNVNTLYLTHTQGDKSAYKTMGAGTGDGSAVLTIHEAQGLTYDHVIVIRTTTKPLPIYSSVPHAVVAVSRHKESCIYFSDVTDDSVGKLVCTAAAATDEDVREYNMRNAIASNDIKVVERMKERGVCGKGPVSHHQTHRTFQSQRVAHQPLPVKTFSSQNVKPAQPIHNTIPVSQLIPDVHFLPQVFTRTPSLCNSGYQQVLDEASQPPGLSVDDDTLNDLVSGYVRLTLVRHGGAMPLPDLLTGIFAAFASVVEDRKRLEVSLRGQPNLTISTDSIVGETVTLRLSGGYVAQTEVFGVRRRLEEDAVAVALLRGLPTLAHRLKDYYVAWRLTSSPPRTSFAPSLEFDVPFLQGIYDEAYPNHADVSYEHDQLCVDNSDLSLGVDRLIIEPGKSYLKPKRFATMRPVLRTMMLNRRLNSQKEAVLGIIKRNLNAPRLADASNTRHFIGECMATNFLRSAIDPDKAWLLDDYKDDPIDLNPALVTKWLETQKPHVATQALSETGLDPGRLFIIVREGN